jgi:bacillithiol system protein YtxJ
MSLQPYFFTRKETMSEKDIQKDSSKSCAVLSTTAELEAAVADSFELPLVLLKHSEWCNRSQRVIEDALVELERWATKIGCRVLVVQDHRELSDAVARLFNIRHETPQVIVLRNGRVTWHAAHFDITSHALRRAIAVDVA